MMKAKHAKEFVEWVERIPLADWHIDCDAWFRTVEVVVDRKLLRLMPDWPALFFLDGKKINKELSFSQRRRLARYGKSLLNGHRSPSAIDALMAYV
jgi:hypothetical protein